MKWKEGTVEHLGSRAVRGSFRRVRRVPNLTRLTGDSWVADVCGEFGILTSPKFWLNTHGFGEFWLADVLLTRVLPALCWQQWGHHARRRKKEKRKEKKPMIRKIPFSSTRRLDWPFMSALSRAIYAREIYARGSRNGRLIRYILRSTHETLLREERMWRGFSYLFAENSTAPRLMGKIWLKVWNGGWSLTAPRLAMLFL